MQRLRDALTVLFRDRGHANSRVLRIGALRELPTRDRPTFERPSRGQHATSRISRRSVQGGGEEAF